ncbi:NAD(P)/FAD-dependent oxidoreductase [Rhodobacter sp. KR11]|jgi:thioredoxin reductase|uniref:NAD(P)/FAD-dependent oxidoreductase n=1 Tax=Rhodobacter sp. KR11 TaxID=2974588 RepID=UPI0022230640|nr:NAD(P)/FAD-dependent oxidoreductase [Rhodobacter sp. KR11]MCW1917523.1 NAD(P)/FAD-dependent oxidoreductase [Rhodobacter sp. KR11]
MQDVIVIGGSYAGMAAALQLLRARRRVLVVDAGQRRNRFASQSHGFLGQDGVNPAVIWTQAREQLLAYPTLTWVTGQALSIAGQNDAFTVTTGDQTLTARRLVLALGLSDDLPAIPGLAARWGQSVFHCPYCHGYELDQGRIGVIATGANGLMSLHQAQMLPEWGETTFLTNGAPDLDPAQRRDLHARGVTVEEAPIRALTGTADILLDDGRTLSFAGLFTASRTRPASPLAESLGCALMETPLGVQIRTSEAKETSIPGVFACGDVARVPHSLSLAVADGAWAGANVHRSLLWP